MRKVILYAVILIGFGLVAVAAYFLIPVLRSQTPVAAVMGRGHCSIAADIPSLTWPADYGTDMRKRVDSEIQKAVAALLDKHEPAGTPPHATISEAQNALLKWCKDDYTSIEPYNVDVNIKITQNAGGILSMQIIDSFKTYGHLPAERSAGLVIDTATAKVLSLADLVAPGQMAAFAAIEHKELLAVGAPYLYQNVKDEIAGFLLRPTEAAAEDWYAHHGYATVTPDAVVVSYDAGDIISRPPEGILSVVIPRSKLNGILK